MSTEGPQKPSPEGAQNLERQDVDSNEKVEAQPESRVLDLENQDAKEITKKIEKLESNSENSLVQKIRLKEKEPLGTIDLSQENKDLISKVASSTQESLEKNYQTGFGVSPSSDPKENYYNQVWSRDLSHAIGNYFGKENPEAVIDSLKTLFKYQRSNGMLPLRVEREYLIIKLIPGLRKFSLPIFNFLETRLKGAGDRPVFEGGDFGGAGSEDSIPSILVAIGEFFVNSEEGREFARDNFKQLEKTIDFFRKKTDPNDGLATMVRDNPDWADTLKRHGKLGGINVWWARSLRLMEFMSNQLGYEDQAQKYKAEFQQVKASIMTKIYNSEEGYFRAQAGEDRLDTVASIFGALYLLNPAEAVKVEEALKKRVEHNSGLQNFDPPYNSEEIFWWPRLMGKIASIKRIVTGKKEYGLDSYHNKFVWPWVTCQNIQVKIKIGREHPEELVRIKYKKEAVDDFIKMSELFEKLGGAYEIVDPEKPEPANIMFYKPPKNFMGSLTAYQGAYSQLRKLGWI